MDPRTPCPVPLELSQAALRGETRALTAVIDDLDGDAPARPTRLPGWSVQLLLAHLTRQVDRVPAYLKDEIPEAPELTWTGYYQAAADLTDGEAVSQRSREFAASIADRPIRDVWRSTVAEAVRLADLAYPDRPLPSPFGALRFDHYLPTRILEITVHGLDLRAALDLEEVATPDGLAVTSALLDALLGGDRPADLTDDLRFVLAATGRAPHDDPRLPLLG